MKGYGATSWGALLAPAGTPKPVIDRINREVVAALNAADVKKRLGELGAEVVGSTPEELAALMKREEARYTKLIRDLNIKPD